MNSVPSILSFATLIRRLERVKPTECEMYPCRGVYVHLSIQAAPGWTRIEIEP